MPGSPFPNLSQNGPIKKENNLLKLYKTLEASAKPRKMKNKLDSRPRKELPRYSVLRSLQ